MLDPVDDRGQGIFPEVVRLATEQAASVGFTMSCDPDTGRLLAALAAGVPTAGRILELGTGTGVGTAWITHGLHDRTDVEVLSVEIEPATAEVANVIHWPDWVHIIIGDAADITRRSGTFDLIFADAQGGKWTELHTTLAALRPGAHLLVDDMQPATFVDDNHAYKTSEVRNQLHNHPDLVSVEITWSTGLILSTRRRNQEDTSTGTDNLPGIDADATSHAVHSGDSGFGHRRELGDAPKPRSPRHLGNRAWGHVTCLGD